MPAKRIIFVKLDEQFLTAALRVDVPEGARMRLGAYHSSYGDPNDPDIRAIREGSVLEQIRSGIVVVKGVGETDAQVIARIQTALEAEWVALQASVNTRVSSPDVEGLYWDGRVWSSYKPAPNQGNIRAVTAPS